MTHFLLSCSKSLVSFRFFTYSKLVYLEGQKQTEVVRDKPADKGEVLKTLQGKTRDIQRRIARLEAKKDDPKMAEKVKALHAKLDRVKALLSKVSKDRIELSKVTLQKIEKITGKDLGSRELYDDNPPQKLSGNRMDYESLNRGLSNPALRSGQNMNARVAEVRGPDGKLVKSYQGLETVIVKDPKAAAKAAEARGELAKNYITQKQADADMRQRQYEEKRRDADMAQFAIEQGVAGSNVAKQNSRPRNQAELLAQIDAQRVADKERIAAYRAKNPQEPTDENILADKREFDRAQRGKDLLDVQVASPQDLAQVRSKRKPGGGPSNTAGN